MQQPQIEKTVTCYHCGEDCDGSILAHEKNFCCNGCQTVYELLEENNLCSYYDLNQKPGISLKQQINDKKYAYLDDAQVIHQLIEFTSGNVSTVRFYIPKIHCSSCIYLLENLYRIREGISRSQVDFLKREVKITFEPSAISLRQVVESLANIGYEPSIQLDDLERKEKSAHLQRYYIKIGIAFFAFGNIMLLSFPEYLGIDIISESPLRKFFGYLNFLLALPVMFYSASEFFVSAWHAAKQRTLNMDIPIALGIIAMFVRSTYEVFSLSGGGYFDTLGSLVLLMLIGRLFQNKTYDTLSFDRDYKSYFPVAVTRIKDGDETTIPLQKLVVGDKILIRNQELIPTDSILLKGKGNIDYSFVTGESTPIVKTSGDMLYAGGKHIGGAIEVEVLKEVSHSYLTQLWNDSAFNKDVQDDITSLAVKVSQWFTPLVIAIAFGALAYWWATDIDKALNAFTSVLIITCPCALALSSPFTLGNMLRILSKKGIYLKNAITIEKLAQIKAIVFDKTGTLTNTKKAKIEFEGDVLNEYELRLIKSLVYHSSHPLSKKVNELLKGIKPIPTEDFLEIEGKGIEGWVDEHAVKIGSKKYLVGEINADQTPVSDFRHASKVFIGIDGKVRGFFLIKNEYRQGFAGLIKSLREKFGVFVLSGDNDAEKNFLGQYFDVNNLRFHQQPGDKLNSIKTLQAAKQQVMMVGDGLNDAGALKQANVGLVIAEDVNNFSPACDGIIEAERFEEINQLLHYAKDGVNVIKGSFAISLLYNLFGTYLAVQGTMSPIAAAIIMPISSVTIILFTTLGSTLMARKRGF